MYDKHWLFFQNKRVKTSKYNQEIGSLKAENANIKSDIVRILLLCLLIQITQFDNWDL